MTLLLVGIHHKSAPVAIREKFYLTPLEQELFLAEFKNLPWFQEGLVLSTCNRTELIAVSSDPEGAAGLLQLLFDIKRLPLDAAMREYFFTLTEGDVVRHLLRVAASVESMVIGEKQVLGQLKTAVETARRKNTLKTTLNLLVQIAVRCGKKAQTETQIGTGGASMGWAAMEWMAEHLGSLEGRHILLIGSGKMAEVTLEQLKTKGVARVTLVNRTFERAERLAHLTGGEAIPFSELAASLDSVDACLCSSGAPHYILEQPVVQKVMTRRSGRPLALVDISIPRNIDPACGSVPGVLYCGMDGLQGVVDANLWKRREALTDVEAIIAAKEREFMSKMARPGRVPQVW